jgi:hypothetical protein
MGDDLTIFLGYEQVRREGLLKVLFLHNHSGVLRPLDSLLVIWRLELLGKDYNLNFCFNLLLACATCGALLVLLERRSRNLALATVLALFSLWHHYQYYPVLIRTGEVDLYPNLIFVGFLALLLRYFDRPGAGRHLAAVGAFAALILTRESYLFAGPVLALAAFWRGPGTALRNAVRNRSAWLTASAVAAVSIGYLFWRWLLLGSQVTQIAGATLDFSPLSIARSFGIFFLDLFTVYLNQEWFVGINYEDVAWYIKAAQFAFLAGNVLLFAAYFRSDSVPRRDKEIAVLLWALLAALLLPGALVSKNDLRYISPSFMVYAYLLAGAIPAVFPRPMPFTIAVGGLAAFVVTTSFYFRQHIEQLYYVYSNRIAESMKAATIDRFGRSLREYSVWLPPLPDDGWALLGDTFFGVYLDDFAFKTHRYTHLDEVDDKADKLLVLSFDWPTRSFHDVTPAVRDAVRRRGRVRFDALATFDSGTVDPLSTVSTPNGRGAFVGAYSSSDESVEPETVLTVISGFHYRSRPIHIARGDELDLTFRMPLPDSDGAGLRIQALNQGSGEVLLDDAKLKPCGCWTRRRLDISTLADRDVQLDVEVYSPSGNSVGDWVAFKDLSILGPPPASRAGQTSH